MAELVTRAILRDELTILRGEFSTELSKHPTHEELAKLLDERFEHWGNRIREDMQSAVKRVMADFQRSLSLALQPSKDLPDRVATLEQADLPRRVTLLEAKVFPPRRATRRR
jgi:hypothetical protein